MFRHKTAAALAAVAADLEGASNASSDAELFTALTDEERAELSALGAAEVLPLSPLQAGLLFHAAFDSGDDGPDVYTVQISQDLEGPLDTERLRRAGQALLDRHGHLRAGFRYLASGRPVAVVPRTVVLPWRHVDLSETDENTRDERWTRCLAQERRRFDPAEPPLLRLMLVKVGPEAHRLILSHQHLLLDGWSVPQVTRELSELYAGRELPPRPRTATTSPGSAARTPRLPPPRGAGRSTGWRSPPISSPPTPTAPRRCPRPAPPCSPAT